MGYVLRIDDYEYCKAILATFIWTLKNIACKVY